MRKSVLAIAFFATLFVTPQASAGTLDTVRGRGQLICGTNPDFAGFALPDAKGQWKGLMVDICQAFAAALKVEPKFRPLNASERFVALASGEVDVLTRQDTWIMSRDIKLGINFVAAAYYDSQGFLVSSQLGAKTIRDLNGASVCTQSGSTAEQNIASLFSSLGMTYRAIALKSGAESRLAYESGRCDFIMGDRSSLANMRSQLPDPSKHIVLKEGVGRDPIGMSVRQGDDQWFKIIRWTYYALVAAETLGVTKENVDRMRETSADEETSNLLGRTGSLGKDLGLDNDFAYRAIKTVGNYGEIFERNLGVNTPLGLERGLNALYVNGGLQYAPPFK